MLITELNFYVKFIFSVSDGTFCFSTTDRNQLDNIKYKDTSDIPLEYKIGDKITFSTDSQSYKIIDITVRQLAKDTATLNYGVDKEDCIEYQGQKKESLFSILISLDKL